MIKKTYPVYFINDCMIRNIVSWRHTRENDQHTLYKQRLNSLKLVFFLFIICNRFNVRNVLSQFNYNCELILILDGFDRLQSKYTREVRVPEAFLWHNGLFTSTCQLFFYSCSMLVYELRSLRMQVKNSVEHFRTYFIYCT